MSRIRLIFVLLELQTQQALESAKAALFYDWLFYGGKEQLSSVGMSARCVFPCRLSSSLISSCRMLCRAWRHADTSVHGEARWKAQACTCRNEIHMPVFRSHEQLHLHHSCSLLELLVQAPATWQSLVTPQVIINGVSAAFAACFEVSILRYVNRSVSTLRCYRPSPNIVHGAAGFAGVHRASSTIRPYWASICLAS